MKTSCQLLCVTISCVAFKLNVSVALAGPSYSSLELESNAQRLTRSFHEAPLKTKNRTNENKAPDPVLCEESPRSRYSQLHFIDFETNMLKN